MVALVQTFIVANSTSPFTLTPPVPPTPGNLMVVMAATRNTALGPAGITGWTTVAPGVLTTTFHHARDHAMFYRIAQSGDTSWSPVASGTHWTYTEWSGVGAFETSASSVVGATTAVVCGGPVTVAAAALIIGGCAADFTNDTDTMSTAPAAGVTELDDKAGGAASPGWWSGYRVEAAGGTYPIDGTATLASGSTHGMAGHTVAFALTSPPVADFDYDQASGVAPLTVAFTDTSSGGPTSWAWTFGDGGTSTDQDPVHIYATPGTYTVSLTATNAFGSDTETKSAVITVSLDVGYVPPAPAGALLEIYTAELGAYRWDEFNWDEAVWSISGWQDVTPLGTAVEILWGSSEGEAGILSAPGAASWGVDFYDPDRLLDPANPDSPYYTDLIPGLPIRLSHRETEIIRGYVESIGHSYARQPTSTYFRATDILSRLANATVPGDSVLSDTLYARAADAIAAAGVVVPLGSTSGTDPALAPWTEYDGVEQSAWDWILDAAQSVLYVPIVLRGVLSFRAWSAPLTRGRSIDSPELIDLKVVSDYSGQYSVVEALQTIAAGGVMETRALTPPPRYGARIYSRGRPTPNIDAWLEAVLTDRALPGLRWIPGETYPLTADSVERFATIEAVELVSFALPELTPPVSATAVVVGGSIRVVGKADDEAIWRFDFTAAQTPVEPLIETGGDPTDYLLATGGDQFLYPSS